MELSPQGLLLITRFEGFREKMYLDAAGLPTIGYGHLLKPAETLLYAQGMDKNSAEALLRVDVRVAQQAVGRLIRVPLRQSQFDALVSFTYNLGSGVLERSTLRRVVNRAEYDDVPEQLMRYVYAGGRKLAGLVRRRQAEAKLFSS